MNWDHASIAASDRGSFTASIDEQWVALKGVHGGIVAALVVEATDAKLADVGVQPDSRLRAATFGYVQPNHVGESTIEVEIVRRGSSMATTHAQVVHDGGITTVGRLHHSSARSGIEFSDVELLPPKPAAAVRFLPPKPVHFANVETFFDPETTPFSNSPRAEWRAWCRPCGTDTFDQAWLTMLGDYFPPTLFARIDSPVASVTIEYAIQFHTEVAEWTIADDGHVAVHLESFHSHAGFAVEDGRIQHPDGTLLATVRQTRLAG